ncbi:alkene reductase [Metabacillus sp. GX 13764]|uniref:alkene reductase n=1 Tax=Metabacillus kandeliae TaxID=2900151 RepID=UPI001E45375E|nr:alkene reductase [Metabacillus kandeliae]MCD7034920.1 alkene reductase [Metabacillus kandeliae]
MSEYKKLFEPVKLGAFDLRSRTAMAPMTRSFSDDDTGVVNDQVVEYYRKRAADGIGLIITEGVVISSRAKGNPGVPGIFTKEQVEAWKKVTDAVHEEGGSIAAQIWHVGRLSHPELIKGQTPEAPSAIAAEGLVPRFRKPYAEPHELSVEDIERLIGEYAEAARNAIEAGFDGVEIHGAHGYLIDQFNSEASNKRTDEYGGDLRQRLTFMKRVISAVIEAIGADRTIIRFSAHKVDDPGYRWADGDEAVKIFTDAFRETGVKIIHPSALDAQEEFAPGATLYDLSRKHWDGFIIGVGSLTADQAEAALEKGVMDVAAFGRPLISNPDFLHKVKSGAPLEEYEAKKHLVVLN